MALSSKMLWDSVRWFHVITAIFVLTTLLIIGPTTSFASPLTRSQLRRSTTDFAPTWDVTWVKRARNNMSPSQIAPSIRNNRNCYFSPVQCLLPVNTDHVLRSFSSVRY
ncbi:hypothetical protein Ddc_07226 [Ditylenchus destructor]|nr:hypothetical protein Ddc_07226 [Ditylenchus destructor]